MLLMFGMALFGMGFRLDSGLHVGFVGLHECLDLFGFDAGHEVLVCINLMAFGQRFINIIPHQRYI